MYIFKSKNVNALLMKCLKIPKEISDNTMAKDTNNGHNTMAKNTNNGHNTMAKLLTMVN
jgi:hypothetical protein